MANAVRDQLERKQVFADIRRFQTQVKLPYTTAAEDTLIARLEADTAAASKARVASGNFVSYSEREVAAARRAAAADNRALSRQLPGLNEHGVFTQNGKSFRTFGDNESRKIEPIGQQWTVAVDVRQLLRETGFPPPPKPIEPLRVTAEIWLRNGSSSIDYVTGVSFGRVTSAEMSSVLESYLWNAYGYEPEKALIPSVPVLKGVDEAFYRMNQGRNK
ncbi:hypothetical protein K2X33_07085 [bacterium]|nr:hypothetical protein [bacterium]